MFGYHIPDGFPILLDAKLLFEHMLLLGSTGTGKTSISLQGLAIQLIRRGDGPVVIFDCKGDPSLFHTIRLETQRTGRAFKWFTNMARRSSYVFNPWQQKFLGQLTLQDILGLVTQSLNLVHGADYARAWFGIAARMLLKEALELAVGRAEFDTSAKTRRVSRHGRRFAGPVQSFSDLVQYIRAAASDPDKFRAAMHLAFIIESLADFKQLNFSPQYHPEHPALLSAIHWPDVIRERQVVYFYLAAASDIASVGQIARLGLSTLDYAAMAHKNQTGRRPRIYTLIDEAQVVIAKNVENMLAQIRDHGIACVLAAQSMDQFNSEGGSDLRDLVINCVATKVIHAIRDKWMANFVSEMSGNVKYYSRAYQQHASDVLAGRVGPGFASVNRDGQRLVNISEYFGPRLTLERIQAISRHPNLNILAIERAEGLTQVHGYLPVYNDWPISLRDHQKRQDEMSWPEMTDETVEMDDVWPAGTEGTIIPTTHPPMEPSQEIIDTGEILMQVKRKLEEDS